jgi:hypothetical protein
MGFFNESMDRILRIVLGVGVCSACMFFGAEASCKPLDKLTLPGTLAIGADDDDCDDVKVSPGQGDKQLAMNFSRDPVSQSVKDDKVDSAAAAKAETKTETSRPSRDGLLLATVLSLPKDKEPRMEARNSPERASSATQDAPKVSANWEIVLSDKTLNAAIARWTLAAGWQLSWELPVDYAVDAHTTIPGSFEDAVEIVVKSMETAEIPMNAIFYKGNKVLRIVPKGMK